MRAGTDGSAHLRSQGIEDLERKTEELERRLSEWRISQEREFDLDAGLAELGSDSANEYDDSPGGLDSHPVVVYGTASIAAATLALLFGTFSEPARTMVWLFGTAAIAAFLVMSAYLVRRD